MAGWKDMVRNVAPALGHALGLVGVPGANALAAVSQALLGKPDATEAEVAERVKNWAPSDELALRAAEQKFTLELLDRAVALEQLDATDRASARQREVESHDVTTRVLAYIVLTLFAVAMWVAVRHTIPAGNRDVVNQIITVLYLAVGQVLAYYFGSSAGSRSKDAIFGKAMGRR